MVENTHTHTHTFIHTYMIDHMCTHTLLFSVQIHHSIEVAISCLKWALKYEAQHS